MSFSDDMNIEVMSLIIGDDAKFQDICDDVTEAVFAYSQWSRSYPREQSFEEYYPSEHVKEFYGESGGGKHLTYDAGFELHVNKYIYDMEIFFDELEGITVNRIVPHYCSCPKDKRIIPLDVDALLNKPIETMIREMSTVHYLDGHPAARHAAYRNSENANLRNEIRLVGFREYSDYWKTVSDDLCQRKLGVAHPHLNWEKVSLDDIGMMILNMDTTMYTENGYFANHWQKLNTLLRGVYANNINQLRSTIHSINGRYKIVPIEESDRQRMMLLNAVIPLELEG